MAATPTPQQGTLFYRPPRPGDICRRKHHRNPQSEAANERVQPLKQSMRSRLLELIKAAGERGATLHELGAQVGKLPHQISGRLSELQADQEIYSQGIRLGDGIWRARL